MNWIKNKWVWAAVVVVVILLAWQTGVVTPEATVDISG